MKLGEIISDDKLRCIRDFGESNDEVATILCQLADMSSGAIDDEECIVACEEISGAAATMGIRLEERLREASRRPVVVGCGHDRFQGV